MTSDQISNDHFFMSEDLEGRLDPSTLIRAPANVPPRSSRETRLADEVSITFMEGDGTFSYPLVSWGKDYITVEVPAAHLSKFFEPSASEFNIDLFNSTLVGLRTTAKKKDGDWFVTIFHFG